MRGMNYQFPCGCSWPIIEDNTPDGAMPLLDFDVDKAPQDCPATWELLGRGDTKGVFQLESPLGRQWTKKLKPESGEHMGALGSILRPGCLRSVDEDGVSTTQHYVRRKNGEEEVPSFHPSVDHILASTEGCLIFQEQCLAISKEVAGFSLQEADSLRKCVTEETLFLSKKRGWVSIKTLMKTGYADETFMVMDEMGRQEWRPIAEIWTTGFHAVHTVNSATGFRVRATKHHQFLTNTGWKARMRLVPDEDYLVTVRSVYYDGEDVISRDKALVIAGMVTEGHFIEGKRSATFVNHDAFMMKVFKDAFTEVFGCELKMSKDGLVARMLKTQKLSVAETLSYGLSAVKRLPEEMMGLTLETTRDFLSFMLAAEGGVTEKSGSFEFSSKSRELIRQVKLLLLRFDIRSLVMKKEVPQYGTYWRLYINNKVDQEKLLVDLTILWPESKKSSLARVVAKKFSANFTTDVIPTTITSRFINQYPWAGNKESGTAFTAPLSRPRFTRMSSRTSDPYWLQIAQGPHAYELVKSVDDRMKSVETFDFTVGDGSTPYIVADGMVIHNSIGKKLPEEMAKCKKMFLEGAEREKKIPMEKAEMLFSWIEESQRYQFNRSHAISYGLLGYDCAYIKAHFPLAFFTSWLEQARHKQDPQQEVFELVNDARLFQIPVEPPAVRSLKAFTDTDRHVIQFGLRDIKGVGDVQFTKLQTAVKESEEKIGKHLSKWTWWEFLVLVTDKVASSVVSRIIQVGALRCLGGKKHRQRLLAEFSAWDALTDKEREWVKGHREDFDCLNSALTGMARPKKDGGGCANVRRISAALSQVALLEKPPAPLVDSPQWMAWAEEELLGISITCAKIDSCDISAVNCTCLEYRAGRTGYLMLGVEVQEVREVKTRQGKTPGSKMGRLTVSDGTCALEAVAFPEVWKEFRNYLTEGNTVIVQGEREKNKEYDSLVIKRVWQAVQTS